MSEKTRQAIIQPYRLQTFIHTRIFNRTHTLAPVNHRSLHLALKDDKNISQHQYHQSSEQLHTSDHNTWHPHTRTHVTVV